MTSEQGDIGKMLEKHLRQKAEAELYPPLRTVDTGVLALRMVQFMIRCADERRDPDDCIDGMKRIIDSALGGGERVGTKVGAPAEESRHLSESGPSPQSVTPDHCEWRESPMGLDFDTDCEHRWEAEFGSPSKRHYKFCPFCGRPIKEVSR